MISAHSLSEYCGRAPDWRCFFVPAPDSGEALASASAGASAAVPSRAITPAFAQKLTLHLTLSHEGEYALAFALFEAAGH